MIVVAASHLLVLCGAESEPADTLKAFENATALRDSIVDGHVTFEELASKNSGDPSAKQNKGYLGYFSVFDMVYPFETGAYNTPVGEISQPVRTGYGYHLIRVEDRMESVGKQRLSHIIIRIGPQYSAKDSAQAGKKIAEIYERLKTDETFEDVAGKYSDDQVSAKKGGDLGWGRLIPEMENVKRKLKVGEFSEPFNTPYGWHILKVTDVEPIKPFSETEAEIKSKIARDARSYLSKDKLIERVKKEGNFNLNKDNLNAFIDHIPEDQVKPYLSGLWVPADSTLPLYTQELYALGSGENRQSGNHSKLHRLVHCKS